MAVAKDSTRSSTCTESSKIGTNDGATLRSGSTISIDTFDQHEQFAAVHLDPDGYIKYINRGFLTLTGWSREDVVGHYWFDLVTGETSNRACAAFLEALASGTLPRYLETNLNTSHRGPILIGWRIMPQRDEGGNILGASAIGEDITERRSQERALARSEQRYHAIVDGLSEAIIILDDTGSRVIAVNLAALTLFCHSEEDFLQIDPAELGFLAHESIDPLTAISDLPPVASSRREFSCKRRDGSSFLAEVVLRHIRIGQTTNLLAIVRDVSDRHALNTRLQQTLRDQQELIERLKHANNHLLQAEKMASIGQLAAGVAHEINNPIGFVSSNMRALSDYVQDLLGIIDATERLELPGASSQEEAARIQSLKEAKEYLFIRQDIVQLLDESIDGLDRVKRIVNDLKDFSRVGEAEWVVFDLHRGIDTTLNIIWNELKYKCVIEKDYGQIPPIRCLGSQLNQVFMNLLINAGQAISDQGTITISTEASSNMVWVSISDTGCGIPPEQIKRIFDPFFTTKPVGKGTGLGLALCYSIIKRHGGHIEVSSIPGSGSTFKIALPISTQIDDAQLSNENTSY